MSALHCTEGPLWVGSATWRRERADVAKRSGRGVRPARAAWRYGSFLGTAVKRRGSS